MTGEGIMLGDIFPRLAVDFAFMALSILGLLTWFAVCLGGWWSLLTLRFGSDSPPTPPLSGGKRHFRRVRPGRVGSGDRLVIVCEGEKVRRRKTVFGARASIGTSMVFHGRIIGVPLPDRGR